MTMYTMKATMQEADDIAMGDKPFIFRSNLIPCAKGDEIKFQVITNGQMKRHKIENMKFSVTYVSIDAPIEKGFKVIGFRRIA